MTFDDLKRPKRTLVEKNVLWSPPEKCRPMILLSTNMRYMRIFAGVPQEGRQ